MGAYSLWRTQTPVQQIIYELLDLFATHPAATDKDIAVLGTVPNLSLDTDIALVLRVLTNMLTNALEATDQGGEAQLRIDHTDDAITFSVWNRAAIPEDLALRVFQRHFSTKRGSGRGIGTYAMTLIGEGLLGGKVEFSTSPEAGTTFRFTLPL